MSPVRSVTYVSGPDLSDLVCAAGLEPATSCVTGRRSNRLNYAPANSLKMTSRSLHSLAVSCTASHVLRRDRHRSRHSLIDASRSAFTRRVLTPAVECHPANRKVDKRLTKRFFEGDPRKGEK